MINERDMDHVFQALANHSRRRMLDLVKEQPGISVGALASRFDVSRIAVMKHLGILEAAGLIISEKRGRVRELYFNVAPIQLIHDRWTTEFSAYWAGHMTRIKFLAEAKQETEQTENPKKQEHTQSE